MAATGAHADGICRFVLTEDAPLAWVAFSRFITTLMALRGTDLLHVRGSLNVTGCRGPVVVQFVQHLAHRPVELQAWPDQDRTSRVVFTTRDLEEKAVRGMFDAVRALG
jgi:G3E family GTPase